LGAKLTVVTVTFHSASVVAASLHSIPAGVRTIVVDNGSNDETVAVVREARPGVEVIALNSNLGFGRASNVGLGETKTPYAFLLNPDCVLSPGSLEALVAAAEANPEFAILGPAGLGGGASGTQPVLREVRNVLGAAMLLRMDPFGKIGFFDEKLFLFGEDNEICLRTRDSGFRVGLVEGVTVDHLVAKSSAVEGYSSFLRDRLMGQSAAYVMLKRGGPLKGRALCLRKLVVYAAVGLRHVLSGDRAALARLQARALGTIDFLAGGDEILFRNVLALRPRAAPATLAAALEKRP
jgi:GT2 family glycosyltransferase